MRDTARWLAQYLVSYIISVCSNIRVLYSRGRSAAYMLQAARQPPAHECSPMRRA